MNKYFVVQEFVDKETYELLGDNAIKLMDNRILQTIFDIRKEIGMPIIINNWHTKENGFQYRGYRTIKSDVGIKTGAHYKGMAVDFDVYNSMNSIMPASLVRKFLYSNIDKFQHIRCIEDDINWNHIDVMGELDSDRRIGINSDRILIYSPKLGASVKTRDYLKQEYKG